MISTEHKYLNKIFLQDKLETHFFSYKKTNSSFILYDHMKLDDFSEEKKIKKLVQNWRSEMTNTFLMQNYKSENGLITINFGFRLYLYMVIASKCKSFSEFRNYSNVMKSIEDFEVMYWYWKMHTNPVNAIYAFKTLFREILK